MSVGAVGAIGVSVFLGLMFLLVVVGRVRPAAADPIVDRPKDVAPGWKHDPAGTPGQVRFWDGSQWATESVRGDAAAAANWRWPRRRYAPTKGLQTAAVAFIVPLMVLTPLVTLIAVVITQLHEHPITFINLGGSNK
jgi:hypothetical protein